MSRTSLLPELLAQRGEGLARVQGAHVGEVEQHAQQLEFGVERVACQLDDLQGLLDALQGEVLGLGGDQGVVGGDEGVDGEQTQRGGAVDEDHLVGVRGELGQGAAQRQLAPEASAQRQLGLGETEVRGDDVLVDRLRHGGAPAEHVGDRGPSAVGRDVEVVGEVALGVEVHGERAHLRAAQGVGECAHRGGLAGAALLGEHRDRASHGSDTTVSGSLMWSGLGTSICWHMEEEPVEDVEGAGGVAGVSGDAAATLDAAAEFEYHSQVDWDSEHADGAWSIRCYDVHKRLGGIPVLNGLNVAIPDETVTVVLGPSGTGKSVLIKHLIGLMFPDSGDIIVHGQSVPSLAMPELLKLRRRIGVLFQDGALFGSMSLFDNVAFPLRQHTDMSEVQIGKLVRQRLSDVGLSDAMHFAPNQLSGGMRKRAGFARALVMEPDVVIFDEPDSGLDPVRTALLCELIKEMHTQYGGTYIVVTHDIASARRIGEFIALLWRGRIVEAGDAEKMFSSENPFVRQFLSGSAEGPLGMD